MENCFCTLFDSRYVDRGLALYGSLKLTCDNFVLWVLCLDDLSYTILEKLDLDHARLVKLTELEEYDSHLLEVKPGRTLVEYYFTCKSCFALFVLDVFPEAKRIIYLDADLYFFSSPDIIYTLIGSCSIAITPHRFLGEKKYLEKYGKFNAGFLLFNIDGNGLACLRWWRERCIQWCYDYPEPERYADQKYLDYFFSIADDVMSIDHPGINAAPWNISEKDISLIDGHVAINGEPLIFFHFHNLRGVVDNVFDLGFKVYTSAYQSGVIELIYKPYLRELLNVREWGGRFGEPLARGAKQRDNDSIKTTDSMPLLKRLLERYRKSRVINKKVRNGEFIRLTS